MIELVRISVGTSGIDISMTICQYVPIWDYTRTLCRSRLKTLHKDWVNWGGFYTMWKMFCKIEMVASNDVLGCLIQ